MKFKNCLIIMIIPIILLLSMWSIPILITYYEISNTYKISDFNLYKDDFQIISDKMLSLNYFDNNENISIYISYKDNKIICNLGNKKIKLTEHEEKSLNNIEKVIDSTGQTLSRIEIFKNRVTFCTDGNRYAITYVKDDIKPKFMNTPKEKFNIKVKKIEKYWYYIIST